MMKQIQAQLALIAVTTSALHLDLGTTEYNNCGFTDEFENCKQKLYEGEFSGGWPRFKYNLCLSYARDVELLNCDGSSCEDTIWNRWTDVQNDYTCTLSKSCVC